MIRNIFLLALIALVAFVWISTVNRSCNTGDDTSISANADGTSENGSVYNDNEYNDEDAEYDDGEPYSDEDSYDINDEDDRVNRARSDEDYDDGETIVDDEDAAYDEYEDEDEEYTTFSRDDEDDDSRSSGSGSNYSSSKETDYSSSSSSGSSLVRHSSGVKGNFLVVCGSYSYEDNADALALKLQRQGYNNAEVFNFDFSQYYSVTAGRYNTISDARAAANRLKGLGYPEAYVHKMRGKKVK